MKPIGHNSDAGGYTSSGSASNAAESQLTAPRNSQLPLRTRSTAGTRLEDIVGVAPKSVRPTMNAALAEVKSQFHEQLCAAVTGCESADQLPAVVAAVLKSQAGFDFVGWFAPDGGQIGKAAQVIGLTSPLDSLSVTAQQAIQEAIQLPGRPNVSRQSVACKGAICVPVFGSHTVLVGYAANCTTSGLPSANRSAIEYAAAKISERHLQQQLSKSEQDVRHVAAIVELVSRIAECSDTETAGKRVVEDLCRYLNASQVVLGTCPAPRSACRLVAVSGTDVDRLSRTTQLAEAVLQESIARAALSVWPSQDASNRHALLSHQQFAQETHTKSIIACPLSSESGAAFGAIFVTFDETLSTPEATVAAASFLNAVERPVATALETVRRTSQSVLSRTVSAVKRVLNGNRLKMMVAAVASVSAAMLIPVDYRVECESELQPVSRRFIAAPFDAPLDECLVEPGDVVETDQLLARLDGRELRWELSGVRADLGKATKEHNAFLSEQKSGEAAIARHEIERLQNKAAVLTDRTKNLELRSPMAGIVVAGDLKETEGVPLKTGQSMFEIAPLDRMVIEVAIPEADIRHVHDAMTVRLILDAMPSEPITATIKKIHPRAELRDHENVFIAEAEIDNNDHLLRPGMRGYAKVSTGSRTLGWTLLHKPVAHIVGWLGW